MHVKVHKNSQSIFTHDTFRHPNDLGYCQNQKEKKKHHQCHSNKSPISFILEITDLRFLEIMTRLWSSRAGTTARASTASSRVQTYAAEGYRQARPGWVVSGCLGKASTGMRFPGPTQFLRCSVPGRHRHNPGMQGDAYSDHTTLPQVQENKFPAMPQL